MVAAWFYDTTSLADPRTLHQYSPNQPVELQQLSDLGVLYWHIDANQPDFMDKIEEICQQRDYKNRDEITVSKDLLPNYDDKLNMFFTEHLHEDEEIRYILDGTGFFDVKSPDDKWIRIQVEKSDLLILPAGIYHRFIVDSKDYIKALRLFKEEPKWTPINRSAEADKNPYRLRYVEALSRATSLEQ